MTTQKGLSIAHLATSVVPSTISTPTFSPFLMTPTTTTFMTSTPSGSTSPFSMSRRSTETHEGENESTMIKRRVVHSKIKLTIDAKLPVEMFDEFILAIETFEKEEKTTWDRDILPRETKVILRSQWLRWPHKLEDETWLNTTTIRFIQFMKAVQHSYFKTAPDSSFVETTTRIVSVLEKEKIYLTIANAVRQLVSLLSRFETAAVLDTDMSTMSTADLEQTKEAFKRNILPPQRKWVVES